MLGADVGDGGEVAAGEDAAVAEPLESLSRQLERTRVAVDGEQAPAGSRCLRDALGVAAEASRGVDVAAPGANNEAYEGLVEHHRLVVWLLLWAWSVGSGHASVNSQWLSVCVVVFFTLAT